MQIGDVEAIPKFYLRIVLCVVKLDIVLTQ